jgi:hypothetical protein
MGELIRPSRFGRGGGPDSEIKSEALSQEERDDLATLNAKIMAAREKLSAILSDLLGMKKPKDSSSRESHEKQLRQVEGELLLIDNLPVLRDMQNFLKQLGFRPSRDALATGAKQWQNSSNQDLIGAALASSKPDWQKFPGRYRALQDVYCARVYQIINRLESGKGDVWF